MHTFNGRTCTIHYHSDFSKVIIVRHKPLEKELDGQDLLDCVAEFIRRERIADLEVAPTEIILGTC